MVGFYLTMYGKEDFKIKKKGTEIISLIKMGLLLVPKSND